MYMSIKTCIYELIRQGYERNHIFAGFSTIHDVPGMVFYSSNIGCCKIQINSDMKQDIAEFYRLHSELSRIFLML